MAQLLKALVEEAGAQVDILVAHLVIPMYKRADSDGIRSEWDTSATSETAQALILNRKLWVTGDLTSPGVDSTEFRIIGVVADVDDENVVSTPAMTIYYTIGRNMTPRLFVRTSRDPHVLIGDVTRILREQMPERPVERPATLEDVRAEVLTPDRLNAFVVSGFAVIALLIAVVGVAGVLAFSVSARTREFGTWRYAARSIKECSLGRSADSGDWCRGRSGC